MKTKLKTIIELIIRFVLIAAMLVGSGSLMALLIRFPFLPDKYVILTGVVLFLVNFGLIFLQMFKKIKPKIKWAGKLIIVVLTAALFFTNAYVLKTEKFIQGITEELYDTDTVSLIVLVDSEHEELDDIIDEKLGIDDDEEHHIVQVLADIQASIEKPLDLVEYTDHYSLVEGLYQEEIAGIFINEAYRELIEEEYPEFTYETKVIYNVDVKTLIESEKGVEVTTTPFNLYISGIDVYGAITRRSRSDVNILMTVNPITKVILLTTIPRDSYLPLGCIVGRPKDKLTHAAIYGVDCSIKTMENAFGIDINYYARVNFTSVVKLVDAIGGIEVEATHDFTTNDKIKFTKGLNYVDGKGALSFARDRKHQSSGDEDRGKNQLKVISAIFNKVISPKILTNYVNILNAMQDNFQTNMPYSSILALGKMQLNDMANWKIITNNVQGRYGTDFSYAMYRYLSMFYPNQASLKNASQLILQNLAGSLIEQPEPHKFPLEPLPQQTPDPRPPKEEEIENGNGVEEPEDPGNGNGGEDPGNGNGGEDPGNGGEDPGNGNGDDSTSNGSE